MSKKSAEEPLLRASIRSRCSAVSRASSHSLQTTANGGARRRRGRPATAGKWERPQARVGDLVAALEAVAVSSFVQPPERFVDLVERLRFHLDQRESDGFVHVSRAAVPRL